MSLRRPDGPAARDRWSRVRACVPGALLAALGAAASGVPAAEPAYGLLSQAAPDFTLHAAVGGNVRLSEHRGEVVVLTFWSSGCGSCRTQLAALNRSFSTYRSAGLEVYGVSVDDEPARAVDYAHHAAVGFPLLLDPSKAVARAYQVDNLPMTVLVDRSGIVRNVLRDYSSKSEDLYLQELRVLLNE
ncbi:MAG TPA: TlpA disulfide reductase family protein [Steroidobacteraceae bacterium]|nr:TlpA disulfide reductase family protein [Steroidobacteraceae bacterium]